MRPIIEINNISKKYRLGSKEPYFALRDVVSGLFRNPIDFLKPRKNIGDGLLQDEFWALKDISFNIMPGETIGIIGRNGAGKSTLLKILSRITPPTLGEIVMRGRVASLLEVGTGFHPELTGRENIYLNGAILGMSRQEINNKFKQIIEFAEIEKFLDTPVKHYSSGMYMRLAFAVAAHLEPEILIIDEVLAVGDAEFQKKCLGKMEEVSTKRGRTIIFVSHNMTQIEKLCQTVVWLENGKIKKIGPTKEVIYEYSHHSSINEIKLNKDSDLIIENICLKNQRNETTNNFESFDSMLIEISYKTNKKIENPFFWLSVESPYGAMFSANMLLDGKTPKTLQEKGKISCLFKKLNLLPNQYRIILGIRKNNGIDLLIPTSEIAHFNVNSNLEKIGFNGRFANQILADTEAMIIMPYEWIC